MEQREINPGERVRILESDYGIMRERLMMINQNTVEGYKKLNQEIHIINQELRELKSEIAEMKSAVNHIIQEVNHFARKDQVKVLEKYINLWSPLNFVTEKELHRILEERGAKHSRKTIKKQKRR